MAVTELAIDLRAPHRAAGRRRTCRACPPSSPRSPGSRAGLMIAHYTAAALVNELQTLAHPSSVDTIPTSANQEDHVSMGGHRRAASCATRSTSPSEVLAIEALCAAQGLDFRAPLRPGAGRCGRATRSIRARVAPPRRRPLAGAGHRGPARAGAFAATCSRMAQRGAPMPELDLRPGRRRDASTTSPRRRSRARAARPATTGSGSTAAARPGSR